MNKVAEFQTPRGKQFEFVKIIYKYQQEINYRCLNFRHRKLFEFVKIIYKYATLQR